MDKRKAIDEILCQLRETSQAQSRLSETIKRAILDARRAQGHLLEKAYDDALLGISKTEKQSAARISRLAHRVAEIAGLEKSTSPLKTCGRCGKPFRSHIEDADEIKDFCTPCLQEMNKKLEIGKGSGPGASMN